MITSAVRGKLFLARQAIPRAGGVPIPFSKGWFTRMSQSMSSHLHSHCYSSFQYGLPKLVRFLGVSRGNRGPATFPHQLPSIQQRLTFSSRIALSRPLRASGMPRPQALARPAHEIGLGTTRRFSSQSAFQHVVENASIRTRAFWEADWARFPDDSRRRLVRRPISTVSSRRTPGTRHSSRSHDQDHYFSSPTPIKSCTIVELTLQANIASSTSYDSPSLLPLHDILENHIVYQARSAEIRAILAALDTIDAWTKGVTIHTSEDVNGLCTTLQIQFDGWSKDQVRWSLGSLLDIAGCWVEEVMPSYHRSDMRPSKDSASPPELHQALDFIMPNTLDLLSRNHHDILNNSPPVIGDDEDLLTLSPVSSLGTFGEWSNHHDWSHLVLGSDFLSRMELRV